MTALGPIQRRLFTPRLSAEHLMHETARWSAVMALVVGLLGVTVLSGWTVINHWNRPRCERMDAKRGVGIDENGRLCRHRNER